MITRRQFNQGVVATAVAATLPAQAIAAIEERESYLRAIPIEPWHQSLWMAVPVWRGHPYSYDTWEVRNDSEYIMQGIFFERMTDWAEIGSLYTVFFQIPPHSREIVRVPAHWRRTQASLIGMYEEVYW